MLLSARTGVLKRDEWLRSGAQARLGPVLRVARRRSSPRSRAGGPGCRTTRGRAGTSRTGPRTPNTSPTSSAKEASVARGARGGRRASRTTSGSPHGWLERRSSCTPRRCRSPSSRRWSATCARRASAATAPGARRRTLRRARRAAPHPDPAAAHARAGALGSAVRLDAQASTTPNNWVAIAARHLVDELLLASEPDRVRDRDELRLRDRLHQPAVRRPVGAGARRRRPMFEKMVGSIQSDEARHAQIGAPVLRDGGRSTIARYAQYLRRQVVLAQLAAVRGRHRLRDGLPDAARAAGTRSFKEFMQEWVLDQFLRIARRARPRAALVLGHVPRRRSTTTTTWSTPAPTPTARRCGSTSSCPGPQERAWLREKYPELVGRARAGLGAHHRRAGARPIRATTSPCTAPRSSAFCDLCQLVLCGGTPTHEQRRRRSSTAGSSYIFCSRAVPLDLRAASRSATPAHKDVVKRVLAGEAPANLVALVQQLLRPRLRDLGQGRVRRRLPWLAGRKAGGARAA